MTPEIFLQLGVAGVCVIVIAYVLKLIMDGRLLPPSTRDQYEARIRDRDRRIDNLLAELERTSNALTAANAQGEAIIGLVRMALGDRDGGS